MLDEVIDTILRIDLFNTVLQQSKYDFDTFDKLKSKVAKNKSSLWDRVNVPELDDITDTNELATFSLEVICNLQLVDFKYVFEAKQ